MAEDALQLALFALRACLNVSALLLIGLALHAAWGVIEREAAPRWRGLIIGLALVAAVLGFARLLVLNLQLGDTSTLFDSELTALGWMTLGPSSLALVIGSAVIVFGFFVTQRVILVCGALAVAAGFALTGHTQALTEPGLAPFGVGLHAALAGFWVAAPLTLFPRPVVANDVLIARLRRFSEAAVLLIPILFVIGLWLAWVLAGGLTGLLGTLYGQLLLLKLAAASIALGVGAFNKQLVTARTVKDPVTGRRWLGRTLAAETIVFTVAILAVSAATTLTGAGEGLPAE